MLGTLKKKIIKINVLRNVIDISWIIVTLSLDIDISPLCVYEWACVCIYVCVYMNVYIYYKMSI
jgi:hypothetical protein